MNGSDQAQLVPAYVEYEYITYFVRTGKKRSQFREISPFRLFAQAIPLLKGGRALGMRLLRGHNPAVGDDVHGAQYISYRDIRTGGCFFNRQMTLTVRISWLLV
jgi:hypothetical protein